MVADGFSKTLAFPPLSTTFPERSAKSLGPICDQVTLGVRVMFADREAAIDPPRIAAVADRDVAEVDGAAEWQAMTVRAASVGIAASREGAPGDYKPEPMFACWLTIFGTGEYAERCRRTNRGAALRNSSMPSR